MILRRLFSQSWVRKAQKVHRCWNFTRWPEGVRTITASVGQSDSRTVQLNWGDGASSEFHHIWLRHSCHCDACKQPFSGQKTLSASRLPSTFTPRSAFITAVEEGGDGELSVEYEEEEGHCVRVPLAWLRQRDYSEESLVSAARARVPPPMAEVPRVPWTDFDTPQKLLGLLQILMDDGIFVAESGPTTAGSCLEIARKIGPIQDYLYGKAFEVVSTPEPTNIAYSSVGLPVHQDISYFQSPPGLQFLHCLQFDDCAEGGESVFLDLMPLLRDFRRAHPTHFDALVKIPATFQKINLERSHPAYLVYQRPHIVLNHVGEIVGGHWAPAFEGPLQVAPADVETFYAAYRALDRAIEDAQKVQFHLRPGDVAVFNNRRILHGREAFTLNGGTRHLQGTYVNIDDFVNKYECLSRIVGDGRPSRRVGNENFL